MTFKGITFSDSEELELADGITSTKLNVTGGLATGFTGQSETKCLIPQSAQYLIR